jgi:hypothetical protein
MKYVLIFIVIFSFTTSIFAQLDSIKKTQLNTYLKKNKIRNVTGFSLLGVATAFFIKSELLSRKQKRESPNCLVCVAGLEYQIGGYLATISSIPFFVYGSKNKRKALALNVGTKNTTFLQYNKFEEVAQPTVSVTINF